MKDIPIYLLTCEGAADRLATAKEEIARVFGDIDFTIVTGASQNDPKWKTKVVSEGADFLTAGEVCCASGHLVMAMMFLRHNAPYGIFLEDDVRFLKPKSHYLEAISCATKLASDWDWINFEFMFPDNDFYKPVPLEGCADMKPIFRAHMISLGTACYAMSRQGALKVIEWNIPIKLASDVVMRYGPEQLNKPVVAFNSSEAYAVQSGAPSLIR